MVKIEELISMYFKGVKLVETYNILFTEVSYFVQFMRV